MQDINVIMFLNACSFSFSNVNLFCCSSSWICKARACTSSMFISLVILLLLIVLIILIDPLFNLKEPLGVGVFDVDDDIDVLRILFDLFLILSLLLLSSLLLLFILILARLNVSLVDLRLSVGICGVIDLPKATSNCFNLDSVIIVIVIII